MEHQHIFILGCSTLTLYKHDEVRWVVTLVDTYTPQADEPEVHTTYVSALNHFLDSIQHIVEADGVS